MSDETNSIDAAVLSLDNYVNRNQDSARRLFTYLMMFSISILTVLITIYLYPTLTMQRAAASADFRIPDTIMYGLFAIFVVVFGVLMAVYRFHLNEIARAEHYKIGFMRIRVAANNYETSGFQSDVRDSLTEDAFTYTPSSVFSSKDKKVDNPLPGHPTSDLSVVLLNKLLDRMEIKPK